jgi:choline-sulfatase
MNRYGLQTVDETCGPKASRTVLSNMTALWEERGVWDAYRRDMEDRVGRGSRHLARPSVLPLDLYYDVYVGQAAVRHLRDLPAGAPWFCWVSFAGPHAPWDAPEPYASMYAPEQMPAPTPRSTRSGRMRQSADDRKPPPSAGELARMRANYAGNVTLIDAQIGEILAAVERRGDLANTFIVFTSDHGEMNGDHGLFGKSVPFDASLKVPLVAAGPTGGGVQGGVRVDSLVELIDVGATIADYADARLPEASCARSLRPIVEGKTPAVREFAISEIDERHLIVTPRWKAEFDRGLAATLLWDRANDPLELVDLSQDPGHGAVLDELRRTMAEFLAATPPSPNAVLRHQAMG